MTLKSPRTYASLTFQVPSNMADDAAGILVADGALGCVVSKITPRSSAMRGRNNPVRLCAYFQRITPTAVKQLHDKLETAGMLADGSPLEYRVLVDPGWATMWQERFTPFRVGRRFLIVPPWQLATDPERIQLVIRPGQGFGTGHHPSTSGTLAALEEICSNRQIAEALDVGTGSGILAIAMVKLGVTNVAAIDTDKTAIANAKENAGLNRVAARIRFSTTPLGALRGQFGVIAANILSSTLIRLAPDLKARLRRRGYMVLAGILRREAETVAGAYAPALSWVGTHSCGAWTTLVFQK
jgi:ribosomal protein L11 methyltransferase